MWTPEHRLAADRSGLRYPSDLTDAEWAIVEPMIPPARHGGRKRSVNVREVLNGIFYILWTGCQWKALPKDLPPKSTVHDYLELWNWDGTLERIHHALYVAVREQEGREASPTVAIIDSQTAKGTQKGGLGSILRATTRARRSKVASGTSWSTRWVSCSVSRKVSAARHQNPTHVPRASVSSFDEGQRPGHGLRCGHQYDRGCEHQTQQTE